MAQVSMDPAGSPTAFDHVMSQGCFSGEASLFQQDRQYQAT